MGTKTKIVGGATAGALALFVLAAGSFWYFFLRDEAPPAVTLSAAVQSLATPTTQGETTSAGNATSTAEATDATTGVNGSWQVASEGETFVGYRVMEELASIGTTTAVGRTSGVEASFVIEDDTLVSGTVTADLSALQSDKTMRDNALRNQALQTSQFPTATFVADGGLALTDALADGEAVTLGLAGKLTLHGVTRTVEVPLDVQLVDGLLVAVGSIDIIFSDYGINKPTAASVLSVEDHGVMELQIVLERTGTSSNT